MKSFLPSCLLSLLVVSVLFANARDPELEQFQGHWEAVELVEDGNVIPFEAIREWLPSGGRFDIVDNSIIITSHEDGKKHVKLFELDGTQYPKGMDLRTREKKEAVGIYRFDEGKLVVCFSDPDDGPRPTEFSAKKGSKRMLLVLKKSQAASVAEPPKSAPVSVAAKILTDEELAKMLPGSWRHRDDFGALVLSLNGNGTWSTIRESQETRLLQKVFVRAPVSSGTWSVKNGVLNLLCTVSVHPDRVNHNAPFTIRSVSDKDLIFVDYFGGLGKAVRVQ